MSSATNGMLLSTIANAMQRSTKRASVGDDKDDGTKSPSEGSRSKENTKDLNAQQPVGVQSASDGPSIGGLDSPINDIGPKKGETGTNVPSTKQTKDDPGTSHPAKAASATEIIKLASEGNDLMASIAMYAGEANKEASAVQQPPAAAPAPATTKQASETPAHTEARVNGYVTGAALASAVLREESFEKAASTFLQENAAALGGQAAVPAAQSPGFDQVFRDNIILITKQAAADANAVADYVTGYASTANRRTAKSAADMPPDPLAGGGGGMGGDPMAAMGGAPPMDGGGGAPPMDPAAGGGAPPMDPAAGGGMPGGDPAAGGGGQPSPEAVQVAQALMSGELTLDELVQALTGGGGEGGGAPPPDAGGGGAPPAAAEEPPAEPKEDSSKEAAARNAVSAKMTTLVKQAAARLAKK